MSTRRRVMLVCVALTAVMVGRGGGGPGDPEPAIPRSTTTQAATERPVDRIDAPARRHRMHHWRLVTEHGAVHLAVPGGLDAERAGIVVYVHGYAVDGDVAWRQHRLAEQFAASGVAAIFVVPEAPKGPGDRSAWKRLDPLLDEVSDALGMDASGPVVVVGHSGAYRTISQWLDDPRIDHVVLLDAAYGPYAEYRAWLEESRAHRMTLVTGSTKRGARRLVGGIRGVIELPVVPARLRGLGVEAMEARVLAMRSQYSHSAIVSSGAVIPVVLRRAGLDRLDVR